jgi:hypothetical protein
VICRGREGFLEAWADARQRGVVGRARHVIWTGGGGIMHGQREVNKGNKETARKDGDFTRDSRVVRWSQSITRRPLRRGTPLRLSPVSAIPTVDPPGSASTDRP